MVRDLVVLGVTGYALAFLLVARVCGGRRRVRIEPPPAESSPTPMRVFYDSRTDGPLPDALRDMMR